MKKTMKILTGYMLAVSLIVMPGCGESQQFTAIPPNAQDANIPRQTVQMKAERFKFIPEIVRVKAGSVVRIELTSIEGTHGFQLGAFGIDQRIDENQTKIIEFYASKAGEYGFRCSHFCGIGHLGMTGKVVVE